MNTKKETPKPVFSHMLGYQRVSIRHNGDLDIETVNTQKSLTQQQFSDDCDINNIVNKYATTGEITHFARSQGVYADMTDLPVDLQTAFDTVRFAEEAFLTIPADVRKRFDNDPAQFTTWLSDPNNYDEGVKLGFFEPNKNQQQNAQKNDDLTTTKSAKNKQTKSGSEPKQNSIAESDE